MSERQFWALAIPSMVLFLTACNLGAFVDPRWFLGTPPFMVFTPYLYAAFYADRWDWWRADRG